MSLNRIARARWDRICEGSGVEHRHAVVPLEDVLQLSTAQRMRQYETHAPQLAVDAASSALVASRINIEEITDLIVVSCTGFSSPGVDIDLIKMLGLRPDVRRTLISFMGCHGAINGLRAAVGACAADRSAIALVVCIELCSLHLRPDDSAENLVAAALFADGAAAAIVAGDDSCELAELESGAVVLGRLDLGRSLVLPEGGEWMSWRITDQGFAMTLSREVPGAVRESIAPFVDDSCTTRPRSFAVHPGGPGILDAVDAALNLRGGGGIQSAWGVLRRCGNMSSGTVLFVLDDLLRDGGALSAMLLAFGPGLSIESVTLRPSAG